MRIIRSGFLAFLVVATAGAAGAASRDEAIQDLRSRFVNIARVEETYTATPRNLRSTVPSPDQEDRALKKVPRDLLLEAIDRVVRDGTKEERSGGIGMYCALIYDRELKPNQEYYPLFLDLLVKDDGSSDYYTFILVNALHWHPTRETVLAYVDVAERSRNSSLRYTALARASDMMGMDLAVYNNVPEEQNEKAMSDFVSWVRRNKDRIRFSKRGHFRLAGGEVSEDIEVLREEDRARIRKDPAGVLRLFRQIVGDEDDSSADLAGECAAGLLGPEGAALAAKRAALAREGKEPTREMEASLASLEGSYPIADAALLAAVYIVSYEKDPEAVKMAREMLFQASRADVRRVAGSEPPAVRKKAERLARGKTAEED